MLNPSTVEINQGTRGQATNVLIEGAGPTIVMLHGWPDSPAVWDSTVSALKNHYRCVRLTLPGYEAGHAPEAASVNQLCERIAAVIDHVSPNDPVTLLLHDWGCFFGYEYAARNLSRVSAVIGADVGDTNSGHYLKSLRFKQKMMLARYQLWLAFAWVIGPRLPKLANRITRSEALIAQCTRPSHEISWQMNYPYAMQWFGLFGGIRNTARVHKILGPKLPTLFLFGKRKPFMFHSTEWVEQLNATPGCAAIGLETNHWLMIQQADRFNQHIREWLDARQIASNPMSVESI